jgi:hypothetical protein
MKPDNFSRKHTLSQSVRVKSAPSTSDEYAGLERHESGAFEVNTNVNTPRKILQEISKVPEIPLGKDSKRKQSATVLASKDCFAKEKFVTNDRRKTGGRVCKNKSRNYEPES